MFSMETNPKEYIVSDLIERAIEVVPVDGPQELPATMTGPTVGSG